MHAARAIDRGWSRSALEANIKGRLYHLVRALPEPLDTNLPSIEDLEAALGAMEIDDES